MTATAARAQGALVIAALLAAVGVTVILVATPVSSREAPSSATASSSGLPTGTEVEIRGGDPFLAYGLADRLWGAGASVGAVVPAAEGNPEEAATLIVYYDRGQQATAERVRTLLGRGTLRHKLVFEPGVDVTIVLGKDLSRL